MLPAQVCGVSSGKLLGLIAIYRTGEPVIAVFYVSY
jgi:hypothetical protein